MDRLEKSKPRFSIDVLNLRAGRPPALGKKGKMYSLLPKDFAYLIRQSRKRLNRSLRKCQAQWTLFNFR
jgi:hypothetical protein